MILLCIDFFDTILHLPNKQEIFLWLNKKNYEQLCSLFQKNLLVAGFPFALFTENELEFRSLKQMLLTESVRDVEEVAQKAESLLNHSFPHLKLRIELTEEYIDFCLRNIIFEKEAFSWIERQRKNAVIKLVSNFYSLYSPLIETLSLRNYFEEILLSCELGCCKPDKQIFEKAEDKLYSKKVFLGDNWRSDILAALQCNYSCIYINPEDLFAEYILRGNLIELLKKYPDKTVGFRNCWRIEAHAHLRGIIDVDRLNLKKDIFLIGDKLYLRALAKVNFLKSFAELEDLEL